jgi:hypothetical protein
MQPLAVLSTEEQEIWAQQYAKSVKADDAVVPIHLWVTWVWSRFPTLSGRHRFVDKYRHCPLVALRFFLLRRWRCNLRRSLIQYLKDTYGASWSMLQSSNSQLSLDVEVERACVWHAMGAFWWEWSLGSRPFFWRWSPYLRQAARDGFPVYISSALPKYTRPQPWERDPEVRKKVASKLSVVRERCYVRKGEVSSLTSFFSVPKGDQDIRLVYDASKSGLNLSLWAPNFGLPTVDTLTRGVTESFWMADLDIGEMFLNFPLHPDLRPLCGIDVRPYFME